MEQKVKYVPNARSLKYYKTIVQRLGQKAGLGNERKTPRLGTNDTWCSQNKSQTYCIITIDIASSASFWSSLKTCQL